ncbi:ABC transporter substrate-binding protein [Acetivibrio mesophilus]|uniref:Solute-binding protein family 3/N-terminal domain-containing protein n=1 Tax=Acetivibrio mesophilus TaxID=2487273 RepID=A0A4Q0I304_9FIRM|nr:ABC transporter substrate-binding protein [Acetivibrio mesophilus]ODM27679.1 hypothetical protein A7W90_16465 [Clostridium sp. Bc-iso-3]RXE58620.1 hypothetical protein EFD62_11375 [Acetivibrio mesophilus]
MKRRVLSVIAIVVLLTLVLSGCRKEENTSGRDVTKHTGSTAVSPDDGSKKLKKITVSYAGGTCEAPLFVAYHKGFFEDEGLEVEFVKADFEKLKTGIASGKIDASVGNFAWFKAIEQGLKVKLTAGIHAGCIVAVAPPDSGIKSVTDLKGKTIGVESIGGGPMIILSFELQKAGVDPKKDVQWKAFPSAQLETAIDKKEIDAFITWDPFGTKLVREKNYLALVDIAKDEPYKSGYCCYTVVSEKLVKEDPDAAARYTRAILRSAEWVGENIDEASKIEVENNYVSVGVEENADFLRGYVWRPGVKGAKENIKFFIHEQKEQGILDASTDETELFNKIFAEVIPDFNGN